MTSRERFLAACRCQPVDRPPIWIMRQAGRYLPEYRQLRSRYGFLELVKTPELATAVTLQPLNRFRLDAGILFCDILVIPEALGQPYHFKDEGGIAMDFRIESPDQIDGLDANGVGERLDYAIQAIRMVRSEVGDRQAVLGFGGSPLTLAAYMVEGGGSPTFARLKQLFWRDRPNYHRLLEKITRALIEFFRLQIGSGVDAVQIFDSWAAICPAHAYDEMSLSWIRKIIDALPRSTPVILYAKGMAAHSRMLASTGASVLGIDWTVQLSRVHAGLEEPVALQGNLDPLVMTTEPEIVESEARRILEDMAPFPGISSISVTGSHRTPELKTSTRWSRRWKGSRGPERPSMGLQMSTAHGLYSQGERLVGLSEAGRAEEGRNSFTSLKPGRPWIHCSPETATCEFPRTGRSLVAHCLSKRSGDCGA